MIAALTSRARAYDVERLRDYSIPALCAALFISLAASTPAFLTSLNLTNVLDQWAPTLIVACGSDSLLRFSDMLYAQSERYRRLQSQFRESGHGPSQRDVTGEHEAITQAVLRRDADFAASALAAHYRATARKLRLALPSSPDK